MGRKMKAAEFAGLGVVAVLGILCLFALAIGLGSLITGCIVYAVVAWLLPVFDVNLGWTFFQCWAAGLVVCLVKGLISPTVTVNRN